MEEIKGKLIVLIQRGQEEILRFAGKTSVIEQSKIGTLENWSSKDTLAHIGAWKNRMAQRIAAALQGVPPPVRPNYDALNAEIFTAHQFKNWDEILSVISQVHQDLSNQVRSLSENDLTDTETFPGITTRPFWKIIAGNSFLHPITHLVPAYILRDQREEALRIRSIYQLAESIDSSPNWKGTILYDKACVEAILGEKQEALINLERALNLEPELIKWSKQDTDLAILRQDLDYQSMMSRLEICLQQNDQES